MSRHSLARTWGGGVPHENRRMLLTTNTDDPCSNRCRCAAPSAAQMRESPFAQSEPWEPGMVKAGGNGPVLCGDVSIASTEGGGNLTNLSSLRSGQSSSTSYTDAVLMPSDGRYSDRTAPLGALRGHPREVVAHAPDLFDPVMPMEITNAQELIEEAASQEPPQPVLFNVAVPPAGSPGVLGHAPVKSSRLLGSSRRLREDTPDDELCPICCEAHPGVAVKGCSHALCGTCARKLCKLKASEAPTCPFCRQIIDGFVIAIPVRP